MAKIQKEAEAKAKAKAEAKAKKEEELKIKKAKEKAEAEAKKSKNYACFIDGRYWRTYSDKKDAESFMTGRKGKTEIVKLDDSKVKQYEGKKAAMIVKIEKQKDRMSAQPGGMPDTWKRVFQGVPKF